MNKASKTVTMDRSSIILTGARIDRVQPAPTRNETEQKGMDSNFSQGAVHTSLHGSGLRYTTM